MTYVLTHERVENMIAASSKKELLIPEAKRALIRFLSSGQHAVDPEHAEANLETLFTVEEVAIEKPPRHMLYWRWTISVTYENFPTEPYKIFELPDV